MPSCNFVCWWMAAASEAGSYSIRRASTGAMRVERYAGIQQARSATAMSSAATAESVGGSVGWTPNNRPAIKRDV